jgi:hypothetical protein
MVSELAGTLGLVSDSDRRALFLCPQRFRILGCMRYFPVQTRLPDPVLRKRAVAAADQLLEIRRDLRGRSESITRRRQVDQF